MGVTFNGISKQIVVDSGDTSLNAQDVYSDWKEWILLSDNAKFEQAFRTFGGDPTAGGQFAPNYFFLLNGWRIVMTNLNIAVSGNLYTEEGDSPFINNNSNITHLVSDASTVSTGGGTSLTPQEIWEYSTRTLTASSVSSLTPEQQQQLADSALFSLLNFNK